MKYFVGITPPPRIKKVVDELRQRYPGRLSRRVEPHVTIVPPVEIASPDAWIADLSSQVGRMTQFSLELQNPGFFGKRVLFLSVAEDGGDGGILPSCHETLSRVTREYRDDETMGNSENGRAFHPHMTLAMRSFGTSMEDMQKMRDEAAGWAPLLFVVEAIRVYVRKKDQWTVFCDLPLTRP